MNEAVSAAGLRAVRQAKDEGKLTQGAVDNLTLWLTKPQYAGYREELSALIAAGRWKDLDDAFWTVIPFGTGGRRGKMFPVGSNAINDRTMGESAQGLADYVRENVGTTGLKCVLAYDSRHRSREFAELCAGVMAANGFEVFFHDGIRSTPQCSYAIRKLGCTCGIMITASHNPPSDNALKVYWSTGGQLLPPHDQGVIDRVMRVETVHRIPFADGLADGRIKFCQAEVDPAFIENVVRQALPGPRDVKILYTPLHGVGGTCVPQALAGDGFAQVEVYGPHATPDGNFPNVPGHVSNPENRPVFDAPIEYAKAHGFDLVLATDPDADRLGAACPKTASAPQGPWEVFTGNQIGILLAEYLLEGRKQAKSLTPEHYVVKTLVTTEMIRRIGDAFGVRTIGDLLVGFKYIAGVMDEFGPEKFVFGTEESHGYLVGQYARDKDAAVASMLLAELAAKVKARGKTLAQQLEALYWQYGYHTEKTLNVTMPGSSGMDRMKALMAAFRAGPPKTLAGLGVRQVRDYGTGQVFPADGVPHPLSGPRGDLVILDLAEEGNYVAVRPSGTEPKVKFYMFAYVPAEQLSSLETAAEEMAARFAGLERDLKAFAGL